MPGIALAFCAAAEWAVIALSIAAMRHQYFDGLGSRFMQMH
jgi:hypothetical protein